MGLVTPDEHVPIVSGEREEDGRGGAGESEANGDHSVTRDNEDDACESGGQSTPLILRRTSTENNLDDYLNDEEDGARKRMPAVSRQGGRRTANAGGLAVLTKDAEDGSKSYQSIQDKEKAADSPTMDLASPFTPKGGGKEDFQEVDLEAKKSFRALNQVSRNRSKSVSLDGSASSLLGQ